MSYRVIIQFSDFAERDRWKEQHDNVTRVYRRNPWLAAEISEEELEQLRHQEKVTVHPDVQLSPAIAHN